MLRLVVFLYGRGETKWYMFLFVGSVRLG